MKFFIHEDLIGVQIKENFREKRLFLLYGFKLVHSAADAARNINFTRGPETVLERTAQKWFARFRSLFKSKFTK